MRSRRKGQTIFELLWLIFILIGLVASVYYGSQWGLLGAIFGGIVGTVASYFLGQLAMWFCVWAIGSILMRSEKHKDNNQS